MNLETIIAGAGYPAVFLLVMGECMGVPLPGETALLIAAASAGTGSTLNIWIVVALAALGAIVGDTGGYWIGRRGGRPLMAALMKRFGIKDSHLAKAEGFFARHGGMAVFWGRSFSYLRMLTALLAGISRMHYRRFLLFNALGGLAWAGVVGFAGFTFGKNIGLLETYIREIAWGAIGVAVVAAGIWYLGFRLHWFGKK